MLLYYQFPPAGLSIMSARPSETTLTETCPDPYGIPEWKEFEKIVEQLRTDLLNAELREKKEEAIKAYQLAMVKALHEFAPHVYFGEYFE
jgi:hypothetical protein